MKQKWIIFTGLSLLTLGVILRINATFHPWSQIFLISGIALKVGYIVDKIIRKQYTPGFEMILLFTGLGFFLSGIILQNQGIINNTTILKTIGISLKVSFIVLFIRKTKNSNQ